MAAGAHVREARNLFHMFAQLLYPERTVESDAQWTCVRDGVPECLGCLAGKDAPRGVGDRAGDHDGQAVADLFEVLLHGEDGSLGVECVEYRFEQDEIGPAFD